MAERLHAVVRGRVQMVGFRNFAQRHAARLGLTGYVRNTPAGEVEVLAEGDRQGLMELLARLWDGPPSALVTEVDSEWLPARGEFSGFRIRY